MDRTTKYLDAVSGTNISSASMCLLASALSNCLPVPPDGVGVSLRVHESGVKWKRDLKITKWLHARKTSGRSEGDKNRSLPLHVPDNDDLDATALASSPEPNTHTDTHKQTQITTTAFSSLSSNSFRDIRNSQRENGPRQISFGDKSDGPPMDVTTALGRQTGHKGSECFKTQQSAHWDYMHYRTGYEIASSHKLVLIHAAHCQCSSRFAKIHCEANSLSVQEPASH